MLQNFSNGVDDARLADDVPLAPSALISLPGDATLTGDVQIEDVKLQKCAGGYHSHNMKECPLELPAGELNWHGAGYFSRGPV